MGEPGSLVSRAFAGIGALVGVAWLITFLVPATRRMMLDWIGAILLQFLVAALLWHTRSASANHVGFWTLLACSWTLNAVATVGWGVHWWLAGREDPPAVSWVDVLYAGRYLLALVALWLLSGLTWQYVVVALLVAAGGAWLVLRYARTRVPSHLLARGLYPTLDAALVCAALFAWRATGWHTIAVLALAFAVYGLANWINLVSPERAGLTELFWPVSDMLALAGLAWH